MAKRKTSVANEPEEAVAIEVESDDGKLFATGDVKIIQCTPEDGFVPPSSTPPEEWPFVVSNPPRPTMCDREWQSYCMGLFAADEVNENGLPYLKGLRRVAEAVIGPIVSMESRVAQGPTPANGNTAVATCRIGFQCRELQRDVFFSGEADVVPGVNLDDEFARFPTAMAGTRARVRALRNALRLDKCAAEEMPGSTSSTKRPAEKTPARRADDDEEIADYQVAAALKYCRDLSLDPMRVVNQFGSNYGRIEEMTKVGGSRLLKLLDKYFKNPDGIPDSVRIVPSAASEPTQDEAIA